jgi:hypothetical protein
VTLRLPRPAALSLEVDFAMPLRRSPRLTPRFLAARRANALKSTGPRAPCGKARVSLNAL